MDAMGKMRKWAVPTAVISLGLLFVSGASGAYSAFVASDYALPRSGGSATLSSASWNKLLDNVEDLQSKVGAG